MRTCLCVVSYLFAEHKTINHSKGCSDGVSNNQAESFKRCMRRAVGGIYLLASNKYLKDYAAEQTWHEDTWRLSAGDKHKHLFRAAMVVGV